MKVFRFLTLAVVLTVTVGCAGNNPGPVIPETAIQTTGTASTQAGQTSNRYTLGLWGVSVDDTHTSVEVIPLRAAEFHLNATKLLEGGMCVDCLQIGNLQVIAPDEIWLDLTIRHPVEENLTFTGFDPRAIFISAGNYLFPESERLVSTGDDLPRLLNPDGFTALFNPTQFPTDSSLPAILKYWPGQYATGGDLTATLNPFLAYAIDQPRRMFTPGAEEARTVKLQLPSGGIQFGYAVDVSWVDPGFPVTDPENDFPDEANVIEPYQVSTHLCDVLTPEPGNTTCLTVNVWSHQQAASIGPVSLEAPELFSGTVNLTYITEPEPGLFEYSGQIANEFGAEPGEYPLLIKVWSNVPDGNLGAIHAWDLEMVPVEGSVYHDPVAIAKFSPMQQAPGFPVLFSDDGSYDPDGGAILVYEWDWENDGTYDEQGDAVQHSWDISGTYYVQMRVTDDEAKTDTLDEPLEVNISGENVNAIEITAEGLNYRIGELDLEGNSLVVQQSHTPNGDLYSYLYFFDVTDPIDPVYITRYEVGFMPWSGYMVTSDGGYVYVVAGSFDESALYIFDVDPPTNVELVNKVFLDTHGPMSVAIRDNQAWIGGNSGDFEFVDIDPPEEAHELGLVNEELVNYPYFMAFEDGYTYVCEGGLGTGVLILDIQPPDYILYKDNIQTFSSWGLCVSGGYTFTTSSMGTNIFDITPPHSYITVKELSGFDSHDMEVAEGYMYGRTHDEWKVFDVDPPGDSFEVAQISEGHMGFKTEVGEGIAWISGWDFGIAAVDIDPPESAAIVNRMFSIDISSKDMILLGDSMYVIRSNQYFYDVSDYSFQAVNVTDPSSPSITNTILMDDPPSTFCIQGDYAYCAGRQLFSVVDISSAGGESVEGTAPISSLAMDSVTDGEFTFVITESDLLAFDVSVPNAPSLVNTLNVGESLDRIKIQGGYAYITDGDYCQAVTELYVVDIDPVADAEVVASIELNGCTSDNFDQLRAMVINGSHLYIGTTDFIHFPFLHVVSIEDPLNPVEINLIAMPEEIQDIFLTGNYVYLLSENGMLKLDMSDPYSISVTNNYENVSGRKVIVDGDVAYVLGYGLQIFEL